MAFIIHEVIDRMVAAASGAASDDPRDVEDSVRNAIEPEEKALSDIAHARIDGGIDQGELESRVAVRRDILAATLLRGGIGTKVSAEQAADAAAKVFVDAVTGTTEGGDEAEAPEAEAANGGSEDWEEANGGSEDW